MTSVVTKSLAIGATLFGGLLAGVTANRALVQMPAWERVGVIPWANFIRAENLGLGSLLYPVVGFMALALTIGAAIALYFDRGGRASNRLPIYLAATAAVVWAAITRFILLPAMFKLDSAGDNAAELVNIFEVVARWSAVNDFLHVLMFVLNLWALTECLSRKSAHPLGRETVAGST
jgi:hypothetical protein